MHYLIDRLKEQYEYLNNQFYLLYIQGSEKSLGAYIVLLDVFVLLLMVIGIIKPTLTEISLFGFGQICILFVSKIYDLYDRIDCLEVKLDTIEQAKQKIADSVEPIKIYEIS